MNESPIKADTYLYIERRNDFSRVPDKLLETFGTPIFVMVINLATKQKLALADKAKVVAHLNEQGFYLQIPPPTENLLKQHLKDQQAMQKQHKENR